MEFGKCMAVTSFDWDDTALIKEYDRIMKSTKKALSKSKESKGASNKETSNEKEVKPWEVGDYCRAVYEEDGLIYEANIISIIEDNCVVDFLGYGDLAEVQLESLQESNGKKARQKQRKKAAKASETEVMIASDAEYSNAEKIKTNRNERLGAMNDPNAFVGPHEPQRPDVFDHFYNARPTAHVEQIPNIPFFPTATHFPNNLPIPRLPEDSLYPIPAPPMPPCSTISRDPAISPMLVSWYMAGYYTGLHQSQKTPNCGTLPTPRCYDRHHCPPPNCCDHHCH